MSFVVKDNILIKDYYTNVDFLVLLNVTWLYQMLTLGNCERHVYSRTLYYFAAVYNFIVISKQGAN